MQQQKVDETEIEIARLFAQRCPDENTPPCPEPCECMHLAKQARELAEGALQPILDEMRDLAGMTPVEDIGKHVIVGIGLKRG